MYEPQHKRARRPDSKQMWDEADRRERDAPPPKRRDDCDRDRDHDRNHRYRSRSPRRDRRRDDRERDRDPWSRREDGRARGKLPCAVFAGDLAFRGRPNTERTEGGREERGGPWRDDGKKERERGKHAVAGLVLRGRPDDADAGRDRRERDRDGGKRATRSRSPRREREVEERLSGEGHSTGTEKEKKKEKKKEKEREKETAEVPVPEEVEEPVENRTATPPVSFKVGASGAQDPDRMDVDSAPKHKKGKDKTAKESVEVEEDDEIVIEDDGMAAMQAMMGFGGFGTTQNKKVAGNDISAVR